METDKNGNGRGSKSSALRYFRSLSAVILTFSRFRMLIPKRFCQHLKFIFIDHVTWPIYRKHRRRDVVRFKNRSQFARHAYVLSCGLLEPAHRRMMAIRFARTGHALRQREVLEKPAH